MTESGNTLDDRLLTVPEAARLLGYAEGTVRNKAAAGELPCVKLGTPLRFWLSELKKWIAERDAEAKAKKPEPAEEGVA